MFRTFLIQIIFALALIINYWADSEEPGNLKMKLSDTSSNFVNGLPEGVTLNGYLDGYYNYNNDFNSALSKFSLLSPYRDEFRVNIAMLKLAYASDIVRGTLTVQYGDIPGVGWPSNMQYLQEANIGFRPFKNFAASAQAKFQQMTKASFFVCRFHDALHLSLIIKIIRIGSQGTTQWKKIAIRKETLLKT